MNIRKQIVAALGAIVLLGSSFVPALAQPSPQDDSSITIIGDVRSVSITGGDFADIAYSLVARTVTGSFTVAASDYTGSGAGWNVQLRASGDFVSAAGTTPIPLANLTIDHTTSTETATGSDLVGPIVETDPFGPTTSNQKLLSAGAGEGEGAYSFVYGDSKLVVPGLTRAGTYTTTLYVEINSGP